MKKFFLSLVVIILLFLCSCSPLENETNEKEEFYNPYSRETVNELVSGIDFGTGRLDAEIVVLDYVYHNLMFIEKYGNDFCINNMGGSDEGNTFFFPWLYEASGEYFVIINEDTWWISVSKSYLGKWKITGCYQEINTKHDSVSSTENPDN